MNKLPSALVCLIALCSALPAFGQDAPEKALLLSPVALEELVSPIALYPDPLIGLILPASTRPAEIVLAARLLDRGGNAETAEKEDWDESVKALTRYREVVEYLDQNLPWTRRLGEAFVDQPDDVMAAIQAVRTRAREMGLLLSNSQQTVIMEDATVRIVPTTPTIIYVPRYRPEVLYVSRTYAYDPVTWLSFGIGYGIGSWLHYDCDWSYRRLVVVRRPVHWYQAPDWRPPPSHVSHPWTHWKPDPRHHPRRPTDRRPGDARPDHGHPTNYQPDHDRNRPNRPAEHSTRPEARPPGPRPTQDNVHRERSSRPREVTPRPTSSDPAVNPTPPRHENSPRRHDAPRTEPPRTERPPPSSHTGATSVAQPMPVPAPAPERVSAPPAAAPRPAPASREDAKPTRAERHPEVRERESR